MPYRSLNGRLLHPALFAATALTAFAVAATARAAEFDEFLGIAPSSHTNTFAYGISADGSVVVGQTNFPANPFRGFRWSSGVMTDIGTLGGSYSYAYGISANGQVVVGTASIAGDTAGHALRWSGGVMTDLGTLGGASSVATAASYDGSVIVGRAYDVTNQDRAFRWTGGVMTNLGTLGGSSSEAQGVSADGTVVVGRAGNVANRLHAFRWSGGVMTDLGTLGGLISGATAVSSDGLIVVGYAAIASGALRAFRWSGGTMTNLGTLTGGTSSSASAVNADGSVVVGTSNTSVPGNANAFRWTAATGMQSITQLLAASGVSTTGWTLATAAGISADGKVIAGGGTNPSGQQDAWIARCTISCAMTSTIDVTQSFSGQSAMGQTGNAALGNTLGTMNEVATQNVDTPGNAPYGVFGYGGYDSDPAASGTLGATVKLPNQMIGGVLASANYVRTNMVYDGNAKMSGGSAGAFIGRAPNAGLQWLAGVTGITLKGDVTRGYLNGSTPASSTGNTTGNGYGVSGRIGWTFDKVWRATQVTPFASYSVTRIHYNGYTETGGPFPAQMNAFNDTAQIARFGVDARYTVAPGKWVWGTLASASRLSASKTDNITGTIIGLFDVSAPASAVAKSWVEATGGVRWAMWKNGAVNASVTASIPAKYATTYQVRLGVSQVF